MTLIDDDPGFFVRGEDLTYTERMASCPSVTIRRVQDLTVRIRVPFGGGTVPHRVVITDPHSGDVVELVMDESPSVHLDAMSLDVSYSDVSYSAAMPFDRRGNDLVNRDAVMRALNENVVALCMAPGEIRYRRPEVSGELRCEAEISEATLTMRELDRMLAEASTLGVAEAELARARRMVVQDLHHTVQPIDSIGSAASFQRLVEETERAIQRQYLCDLEEPESGAPTASAVAADLRRIERQMRDLVETTQRCAGAFERVAQSMNDLMGHFHPACRCADGMEGAREVVGRVRATDWGTPIFETAAEERAEQLLVRHLSPAQVADYREHGGFCVVGGKTGRRYRIRKGRQINVLDYERRRRLCLVMPSVPIGDQLLGQKLLLEGDEDAFLSKAIEWGWPDLLEDAPERYERMYRDFNDRMLAELLEANERI